jgi:ribonuclease HI
MNKLIYKLYTDGATSKNGYEDSRGGYAWALIANDKLLEYKSYSLTPATNNICEMKAIIEGCRNIVKKLEPFDIVLVYSDSSYCINCYTQNWFRTWQQNGWKNSKKEPVANKELWQELIEFFDDVRFKFNKVKGHNGKIDENSKWNEFVDKLAVEAKSK